LEKKKKPQPRRRHIARATKNMNQTVPNNQTESDLALAVQIMSGLLASGQYNGRLHSEIADDAVSLLAELKKGGRSVTTRCGYIRPQPAGAVELDV